MRKLGITTYFDSFNEGTMLQSYSVKTLLEAQFPDDDVELVKYRFRKKPLPKYLLDIRKPKRNYFRLARQLESIKFVREHLNPEGGVLESPSYAAATNLVKGKYDILATGSDTVWQILDDPSVPSFPNIYWLPRELKAIKISMAVSANRTRFSDLSESQRQWIAAVLHDYSFISVRDDITEQLVADICPELTGRTMRVPDPTFGLDFPETCVKEKMIKAGFDFNRPIIGFNLPDTGPIRELFSHYGKQEYQFLPLAGYNDLMYLPNVKCMTMSPFEWAEVYKYLALSITERFHGTVFSLKRRCPVMVLDFDEAYRGLTSKTMSVLKEFSLEDRHLIMYDKKISGAQLIELAAHCLIKLNAEKIQTVLNGNKLNWDCAFKQLKTNISDHST